MSKDRFQDCQEIRIQDTEEVGYDTIGSERKTWWKIKEEEVVGWHKEGGQCEEGARKDSRIRRIRDSTSTARRSSVNVCKTFDRVYPRRSEFRKCQPAGDSPCGAVAIAFRHGALSPKGPVFDPPLGLVFAPAPPIPLPLLGLITYCMKQTQCRHTTPGARAKSKTRMRGDIKLLL